MELNWDTSSGMHVDGYELLRDGVEVPDIPAGDSLAS